MNINLIIPYTVNFILSDDPIPENVKNGTTGVQKWIIGIAKDVVEEYVNKFKKETS